MDKIVLIYYERIRLHQQRSKPRDMERIVEPYRLSLLDVLKKNFKAANRVNYLHRIIYICSHSYPNFAKADAVYQEILNNVDQIYLDERLSGLMLYYPEYFCCILESSEQTINRMLIESAKHPDVIRHVHKKKLLGVYHNINQRLVEEWMVYSDKPPTLLEKIDLNVDRHTATRYVYNCIKKLYGLVLRLRPVQIADEYAVQYNQDSKNSSVSFQNPARLRLADYLPEYSLLDFLMKTEHTQELSIYALKYGYVPDVENYQSMIWPPTSSYVPFNVFDSFQDPIQDLPPRELIKLKEVELPKAKSKETKQ